MISLIGIRNKFIYRFMMSCEGPVDANISVSFSIKDGNKRP